MDLNHIETIANYMSIAAKTAPKAKGLDNVYSKIICGKGIDKLADDMLETGAETERIKTFKRDADNVKSSAAVLILAAKKHYLNLDCGFCGFENCAAARARSSICAFNSCDLGIALSSALEVANRFHIDNRVMYTIGYTAQKKAVFGFEVAMAIGIPLSATSKNPFFDR